MEQVQEVLGTHIRIVVNSQSPLAQKAVEACFLEVKRIEQEFSRFISGNQLAQLNEYVNEWVSVSPELFSLLSYGKIIEEKTHGAFTLSIKSVLESWGYNQNYELDKEFGNGKVGAFELKDGQVFLTAPVEIGGIGKGYALDQMKKILGDFENIFINAGGDIYGRGRNEKNEKWKCFLEHPQDASQAIGEVEVDDFFLTSSSPTRRRWRDRHHLVDARILEPANNMLTTYVQASTGIDADTYSTVLFVLGYEDAKKFLETEKIPAVLVGKNGDIFKTADFKGELYF